jgi:hypothetical protein
MEQSSVRRYRIKIVVLKKFNHQKLKKMKSKLFLIATISTLALSGIIYGFTSSSSTGCCMTAGTDAMAFESCSGRGQSECPLIENCPLKGTPACPYAGGGSDCCKKNK